MVRSGFWLGEIGTRKIWQFKFPKTPNLDWVCFIGFFYHAEFNCDLHLWNFLLVLQPFNQYVIYHKDIFSVSGSKATDEDKCIAIQD